MPASTTEADIIFNRANVALAKSQRLIASWLPPRTEAELQNTRTEEEIEREEQEMFAPVPELLGLGAPLPQDIKDGDVRRQELRSNDKLCKQLLGKEFAKLYGRGMASRGSPLAVGSKPRPAVTHMGTAEDEEEEDGGRSSLGRLKRKHETTKVELGEVETEEVLGRSRGGIKNGTVITPSKRATSYLDEVLAEKQLKKLKKEQKHK